MEPLVLVRQALLIAHFIGLAAVIGPFVLQLRTKSGFRFGLMFIGALTQVVSGVLLVGLAEARDFDVDYGKITTKLVLGIIVLAAVIVAQMRQRRALASGTSEKVSLPWLHIAGAGAIANVIIAVVWR